MQTKKPKRGHTSRSVECSCRVIKTEKESAKEIAKTFKISEKEAVRLCIIWLGRKLNKINFRLTKCKRIGQEQLAREWSKEYDGRGSKLKKLKEEALGETEQPVTEDKAEDEEEPKNAEEKTFKKRYGDLRRHSQEREKPCGKKFALGKYYQ